MPYKTILAATDFSDSADEALDVAAAWAERDGASLHVLHVLPEAARHTPIHSPNTVVEPALMDVNRRVDWELASRLGEICAHKSLTCEAHIESGEPYSRIVEVADKIGADLVVVGSLGKTGLKRLVLGSTAERVARTAPCAVLVWREGPKSGPILAATDFSEPGQAALLAAADAARAGLAEIAVLHCLQSPPLPGLADVGPVPSNTLSLADVVTSLRDDARRDLTQFVESSGVRGSTLVEIGPAASTIVSAAQRLGASMVVVGTVGRTGMPRLLMGSTAEAVVRSAPCPVMVVRKPQETKATLTKTA